MNILYWLLIGLAAGAVARLLVPGRDRLSLLGTLIVGLIGSLLGGFLGSVIQEGDADINAAGLIGSIIGAVIVLLIWRWSSSRRGMGSRRGALR